MRNLKKLLALVLAMMMAFSLMVSANATTTGTEFSDEHQITEEFVEAAEVLTGMKVFQGDNGSFRPASQITRAEVAALIYRLATGDTTTTKMDLYSTTTPFTDVQPTDWFAGYVGYCWNAGYIKGRTPDIFDPYGNVTGYEALAMVLRAMGYDQNGEFTGITWTQRVASIAQQRGLLADIQSTNYANTLHMASRRDVVASILFKAAQANRVVYTPAYGYQTGDHTTGVIDNDGDLYNEYTPLGVRYFNLRWTRGNLLANQDTGETKTILSQQTSGTDTSASRYSGNNHYDLSRKNASSNTQVLNLNLTTGLEQIGHKMKVWYKNNGDGKKTVYAYIDESVQTDVVKADNSDLTGNMALANGETSLRDAAKNAGFGIKSSNRAVFNNSFGPFGAEGNENISSGTHHDAGTGFETNGSGASVGTTTGATDAFDEGYVSPVKLYKLIANNSDKNVDVVIALNIEVSKITESNNVNRVPTLGMPVENWAGAAGTTGTSTSHGSTNGTAHGATAPKGSALASDGAGTGDGTFFVSDNNVKTVWTTGLNSYTGVIAQDALRSRSTKNLGDYEFGIHITGTNKSPSDAGYPGGRDVSDNEKTAIDVTGSKTADETAYFLLSKISNVAEGTVVAYNITAGTVTLNDGTVLNRSKYYNTVVGHNDAAPIIGSAPDTALPQAWTQGGANWEEGYANVEYRFFLDHEGNYLGAERGTGSKFLYGTYLDYSQATSTSTFNYFLTGVNLTGEIETVQLSRFWNPTGTFFTGTIANTDTVANITGTDQLTVPYRDTSASTTGSQSVNGIHEGVYAGFAINTGTADGMNYDSATNRNEYLSNMARLGVMNGDYDPTDGDCSGSTVFDNNGSTGPIDIDSTAVTLGAVVTSTTAIAPNANSNKYFTEGTKFILVSGFGTDSVKAEVYNGISELKGNAAHVYLDMTKTVLTQSGAWSGATASSMTYYTESPYTYAQSGNTAMKIDTIILPKEAVSWTGGTGLFYVGDPNATLVNSFGIDAWKYTMYVDGEARQVWLTNQPGVSNPGQPNNALNSDAFYHLKPTDKVANDGQPIYTAGKYAPNTNGGDTVGQWYDGIALDGSYDEYTAGTTYADYSNVGFISEAWYSAITSDAQTATIAITRSGSDTEPNVTAKLYRVAGAKVVNLNVTNSQGGYIWPGITDLTTLNQAGSINPVTDRPLRISAVLDSNNPLVVTTIYVCWDQRADS